MPETGWTKAPHEAQGQMIQARCQQVLARTGDGIGLVAGHRHDSAAVQHKVPSSLPLGVEQQEPACISVALLRGGITRCLSPCHSSTEGRGPCDHPPWRPANPAKARLSLKGSLVLHSRLSIRIASALLVSVLYFATKLLSEP